MTRILLAITLTASLVACQAGKPPEGLPGNAQDTAPYAGIAADETVRFVGTEPFWGGSVSSGTLIYTTPERPDGDRIAVERFAGRGGVSWTGNLRGSRFALAVTPGVCSDGMSDRTYPFVATLEVEGGQQNGCGWTEKMPFSGPENP